MAIFSTYCCTTYLDGRDYYFEIPYNILFFQLWILPPPANTFNCSIILLLINNYSLSPTNHLSYSVFAKNCWSHSWESAVIVCSIFFGDWWFVILISVSWNIFYAMQTLPYFSITCRYSVPNFGLLYRATFTRGQSCGCFA